MMKVMARRPRGRYCKKPFTPPKRRGRPPHYCSPAHRQRAYERRRAQAAAKLPMRLMHSDVEAVLTRGRRRADGGRGVAEVRLSATDTEVTVALAGGEVERSFRGRVRRPQAFIAGSFGALT